MGEIEASLAAAFEKGNSLFFWGGGGGGGGVGKYCPFFFGGGGEIKMEKKVSSRTFFSHLATSPETKLFLWTASDKKRSKILGGPESVTILTGATLGSKGSNVIKTNTGFPQRLENLEN